MPIGWPDAVDEILAGDQVVMLGSVTPAGGVVLGPVTNFAVRDRDAGTITVNSAVGASKKLERIRRNPRVALAFHTRQHSLTDRPEYVLVQGTAALSPPIADHPETIRQNWERFAGPLEGRLWRRWLRAYYTRVNIEVAVHRALVWPELAAKGTPQVHGAPLPDHPVLSQQPPAKGTGPRLKVRRAAETMAKLPHALLGWADADGYPLVVPVEGAGANSEQGLHLRTAGRLLPAGGRRAGLTAHAFNRHVVGQHQREYTGWLETEPAGDEAWYAPHTQFGYRMPSSRLIYRLGVGYATRRGLRLAAKTAGRR